MLEGGSSAVSGGAWWQLKSRPERKVSFAPFGRGRVTEIEIEVFHVVELGSICIDGIEIGLPINDVRDEVSITPQPEDMLETLI